MSSILIITNLKQKQEQKQHQPQLVAFKHQAAAAA